MPIAAPRETSGALIGGVTGGLLGNTVGHGNGQAATTIVGAALGALSAARSAATSTSATGNTLSNAADRGFRDNRVESWNNARTGHRGEFRPRRVFDRDGQMCRDFTTPSGSMASRKCRRYGLRDARWQLARRGLEYAPTHIALISFQWTRIRYLCQLTRSPATGRNSFQAGIIMSENKGLMAGKRGLIMGVANNRSIAWGIAKACAAHGAELAFTYQGDAIKKRVEPLAAEIGSKIVVPCDVTDMASIDADLCRHRAGLGQARFRRPRHRLFRQGRA